jgi:hypothetical protein
MSDVIDWNPVKKKDLVCERYVVTKSIQGGALLASNYTLTDALEFIVSELLDVNVSNSSNPLFRALCAEASASCPSKNEMKSSFFSGFKC